MMYRNKKLLEYARDRECVLCGIQDGTIVAAHSNALEHGRGMHMKAPDFMVSYVCGRHHDLIDGRAGGLAKAEKREMWLEAWVKTVPIWFNEGVVK